MNSLENCIYTLKAFDIHNIDDAPYNRFACCCILCIIWSVCEKNVCSFQISKNDTVLCIYTFCNGKFNFMANLIKNFNEDGIF